MRLLRIFALLFISLLPRLVVAQAEENPSGQEMYAPKQAEPTEPPSSMEIQAQPGPPTTPPAVDNYSASFFKMLSALIVLLIAVILVVWLFKNLARGRFTRGSSSHIEIIERRALSQKSMLYLIEVDGKRVLIAESQLDVRPLFQESASHVKET